MAPGAPVFGTEKGAAVFKSFPGFAAYTTHHCVSGSLRDIYDFHGLSLSEDTTSSATKAQASLQTLLEANEPVLLHLDMGLLPYFDFPPDYHFGGHVVVAAGYEPDTKRVLIADRDDELHPVDWDVLERARGSTFKPFPPRHEWYTFDFTRARSPTRDDVREAILDVCHAMLEPPIANLGVKWIVKAQRETRKWPQALDTEALRRTCFTTALMIDHRGGTGGGCFRYMYERFLDEAATITSEPRLAGPAAELASIGDLWEQVAKGFTHAAETVEPGGLLDSVTEPLAEIADREQRVWENLRSLVSDGDHR